MMIRKGDNFTVSDTYIQATKNNPWCPDTDSLDTLKDQTFTCNSTRTSRGTKFIRFQHDQDEDGNDLYWDVPEEHCEKI